MRRFAAMAGCVLALATCTSAAAVSAHSDRVHVSPADEDRAMVAVAPMFDGSQPGVPARQRAELRAFEDRHDPHLVALRALWTVPDSESDVFDQLSRTTPGGMRKDGSLESNGTVEAAAWLLKDLPPNLLTATLTVAITPISDDQTAVLVVAASERALPVAAYRLPASIDRLALVKVTFSRSAPRVRRWATGADAAALVADINSLRAYSTSPDFICGSQPGTRVLVKARTQHHSWTVDAGSCRPTIVATRDDYPPRYFHRDKAFVRAVRRTFGRAEPAR